MAAVTNFKDMILDMSGDPGDDNALETWVLDGCYAVVDRVTTINPLMMERFASEVGSDVTAATTDIDETVHKLHMVYRKRTGSVIGSEVLATKNVGFESAIAKNSNASAVDDEWIDEANESSSNLTITRTSGNELDGSYKGLIDLSAGQSTGTVALKETGLTQDTPYRFSLYGRNGNSTAAGLVVSVGESWNSADVSSDSITLTSSYQATHVDFIATSTTMYLRIALTDDDEGTYAYIDELSLKEIDFVDYQIPCRKVASAVGKLYASNPRSVYYSNSVHDPIYYVHNELLNIYPAPTSTLPARYTFVPVYAITNFSSSTSSIDGFPVEYYEHIITYAAVMSLQRQLRDQSDSLPSDITLPVLPSNVSLSSISTSLPTFSAPAGFVLPASVSAADVDFSSVPTAPTFTVPAIVTPIIGSQNALTLPSAPIAPASPSITAPSISPITVTHSGTAPSYNKPVFSAPSLVALNALALPVPPATPGLPSISSPGVATVSLSNVGTPPTYTRPTVAGTADELTDVTALDGENEVDDFDGNAIEFDQWFATVAHFIEDEEDLELAQAQIGKISTYITAFQAASQDALNKFNKENAEYQAKLQEAQSQAQINAQEAQKEGDMTLQASIQDYTLELQKYSSDLTGYSAEVQATVQKWTNEELEKKFREWTTEYTNRLSEYTSNMQNALNDFNKENAAFQAAVQVGIKQAEIDAQDAQKEGDLTMQATIQDYTLELQKFQGDVQKYGAEVQATVQKWTSEERQVYEEWVTEYQSRISKFQSEIQGESQRAQNDVTIYQKEIDKALQKYQSETGYDINKFRAALEAEAGRFRSDLEKQTASFQSDLGKYTAEVQSTSAENQDKLGKFQAESNNYRSELESKVKAHETKLQKHSTDYQWLHGQYQILAQKYEMMFAAQGLVARQGKE